MSLPEFPSPIPEPSRPEPDDLVITASHTPSERLEHAMFEAKRILVGQDHMVEQLFVSWLARGHCLIEGAPGLAKTLAAETVATIIGGSFARLQFTPDLVPSDLVGTRIYRPRKRSSTSSSARSSPTSCSPTRSTGPLPRCSLRCSR
jgi:MoxR-like ATPase